MFPAACASALEFYHSDHRPINLVLKSNSGQRNTNPNNLLTIILWLTEVDCGEVIKRGWEANGLNSTLTERISSCKYELQNWANLRFKNIPKQLKDQRAQLNQLCTSCHWDSANQIKELKLNIEKLASKEDLYWSQRSRISWLKDGDRNSRFFHVNASNVELVILYMVLFRRMDIGVTRITKFLQLYRIILGRCLRQIILLRRSCNQF